MQPQRKATGRMRTAIPTSSRLRKRSSDESPASAPIEQTRSVSAAIMSGERSRRLRNGHLERAHALDADPDASLVRDDRHERVLAVRAAEDDAGAAKDLGSAHHLARAAPSARPDGGRHLDGEHLLEEARDRVAVQHQLVHLTLPWLRSARS